MGGKRGLPSISTVRTVWLVVVLAIAFELVLIPVFGFTQLRGIRDKADEALNGLLQTGEGPYTSDLPEAYIMYEDEVTQHKLYGAGADLGSFVLAHQDELPVDETLTFGEGDDALIYQLARGSWLAEESPYPVLLVYCDVGFSYGVMRLTLGVMVVVAAVTAAALVFAGRAATRAIERRDESQRAFFANASHELKTPLMTIQGNTCGMRDGFIGTHEGCEAIDAAAERMSGLVGDILELSRVDAGVVTPRVEACDVREIVYDALSAVRVEADRRHIALDVNLEESLPRKCDEGMTFTIVSNVVTNGVRHARSRLCVSAQVGADGALSISVVNDGDPITNEDRVHAFDRFYCGEQGQTGIGLSLAQEYASLQGGSIAIRPLDAGTEFTIVLPS